MHSQPSHFFTLLSAALGLLLCSAALLAEPAVSPAPQPSLGQPLEVSNVSGRYINRSAFYRITEFFTGKENKGGKIIERSQPNERSGYYLIVNLELLAEPMPQHGAFVLEYIHSDDRRPHSCIFPIIDAPSGAREAFLGLTGNDWPTPDRTMVAWKLTVLNASGEIVASEQSFLWDLPQ